MAVTFHRGLGSRASSTEQETVDLLGEEQLRAVVNIVLTSQETEAKETLRPIHMAGCSPRVFWSLVRLFGG